MSQTKKSNLALIFIFMVVSFFMFGCEKSTPVNDISFNLDEGEQIVLMIGQTLELDDYISIKPTYASNQKYSLSSFDESIVTIDGVSLKAITEGVTQIKVVADDNNLLEDVMTVVVKKTKTTLNAPLNLAFNETARTFNFDAVTYASSYTIKINGEEYDLGNSTVFSIDQYLGAAYDNLLSVQVRANAPSYTYALESSAYSEEYQMYQAGKLENINVSNGVLSFNKPNSTLRVNVYLGNALLVEKTEELYVSLKQLDEIYAGKHVQLKLESVVSDAIKTQYGADVVYFNSTHTSGNLTILDVANIEFGASGLSWQNVVGANGYAIFVDDVEQAQTNNNYFDLNTLEDYDDLFVEDVSHEIIVEPLIGTNSTFVGKTIKTSSISVQRLNSTNIYCENSFVKWNAVDDASHYLVTLSNGIISNSFSTLQNSYNMSSYDAGNYSILVQAMGNTNKNGSGNYILASKAKSYEFDKLHELTQADVVIEDYNLKVSNLGTNECSVEFENATMNKIINSANSEIDLADAEFVFEAGLRTITLKRLGDIDSIESDILVKEFVQLEKISNINILNGVASVVRTSNNENANITFVTKGAGLASDLIIECDEFTYNTTDSESIDDDYLQSGTYETSVYVYGDGETTFSYRENGEIVACATVSFTVLPAPTLELKNSAEETLTIAEISNAIGYNVYSLDGETSNFIDSVTSLICKFELDSGTGYYTAQAKGNQRNDQGDCCLDSCLSDRVINVTRLAQPKLTYNSSTQVVSKSDNNDSSLIAGYNFTKDGVLVEPSYDFESKFDMTETSVLALQILAKNTGADRTYYLDSKPFSLTLSKISNDADIYLNADNNIVIEPQDHDEEYLLIIDFDLGGTTLKFTSQDGKLVCEDKELQYAYHNGKYIINIIDNFNIIIDEMDYNFSVDVQFVKASTGEDSTINSEVVSEDLSIVKLNNTSTIKVDENNNLLIKTTELTKEYGLIIVVNDSEDLTFTSNGETLVSNEVSLAYEYDSSTKTYQIPLLDNNYKPLHDAFASNFTISVKFTNQINATEADLDSDFTSPVIINIQTAPTLTRGEDLNDQKLIFNNIKPTYTTENYQLFINDKYLLALDPAQTTFKEGYFSIDVNYIYNNTPDEHLQNVNSVSVIVNDLELTEENPLLSAVSEKVFVEKAQQLTINSFKYNNNEDGKNNNSVVISLSTAEISTSYNKFFVFEIYNQGPENKVEKIYVDTDVADNGNIVEFNLDDVEISGTIYVRAYIKTNDNYFDENTIEVFNSDYSNVLEFIEISAVQNLAISNSILTFDSVADAVGYEIYSFASGSYEKINKDLLFANQYEFTTFEGQKTIVVKAISKTNGYSNSNYSDEIVVDKLTKPEISVENGKFKIALSQTIIQLLLNDNVKIIPEITNVQNEKVKIDLEIEGEPADILMGGLSGTLNNGDIHYQISYSLATRQFVGTLVCEPYMFLSYNSSSAVEEKLNVQIRVEYTEPISGVYYLNSNTETISGCGLFEPTKINKTTNNDDAMEFITWSPSTKNTLNGNELSVGYVFKIVYGVGDEVKTYYSNDNQLKYYDLASKTYVSYPAIISGVSAVFPAGYDENGDGELDVVFGAGNYVVSAQTVPAGAVTGYNICSSKYSNEYKFEILEKVTLKVEEGKIAWNELENADEYRVSIYEGNATEAFVVDTTSNAYYDLTDVKLKELQGVTRVVVKALSKSNDVLNGADSDELYVYKLPEANSVNIDDGYLMLSATPFFTTAKIEFVDKNNSSVVFEEVFDNTDLSQSKLTDLKNELTLENWKGFVDNAKIDDSLQKFSISLNGKALNITDGMDYTINVTLIGNSSNKLGFVNSSTNSTINSMTATKLKPNATEVSLGTVKFKPNDNYIINTESSYTTNIDFNYSFNGATSTDFWHKTVMYKITIEHLSEIVSIFAVDYYCFKNHFNIEEDETNNEFDILNYEDGLYAIVKYNYTDDEGDKTLYFNVYKDNIINLKDYDYLHYYPITENIVDGVHKFEGETTVSNINLKDGGSFTIGIAMLGGDSSVSSPIVGHLNSTSQKLQTFVRYGLNQLSTLNGELIFNNLIPLIHNEETGESSAIDHPVYKLVVTDLNGSRKQVFYLYYEVDAESLNNAKLIAERNDAENYQTATYLPVKTVEDVEGILAFDLSQYLESGAHKATIQTLAGMGNNGNQANYLLNAKEPITSYTLFKLTDTTMSASNGVLEFAQSYIERDTNKIYFDDYEITIIDTVTGEEYVYNIGRLSDGVKIDNHKVTYKLPAQLAIGENPVTIKANNQYEIKVRAISIESYVLNGTYAKDTDDITLAFTKAEGISEKEGEKLRIEDGILKWKVPNPDSYTMSVIKISFLDENSQPNNIFIEVGDYRNDGDYEYHYFEFGDIKYDLETLGKDFIHGGKTYSITIYLKGVTNGENIVLDSDYSSTLSAERLNMVNNNSIRTEDGILTWGSVDNAIGYRLTIVGDKTEFNVDVDNNSYDIAKEQELPEGNYSVKIRALGDGYVNSMISEVATGFVQLGKVDFSSIKIEGPNIVWDSVDNAQGYLIKANYNNGVSDQEDVEIVTTNSYEAPTGVVGKFTISITPVGVGSGKIFNGKSVEFESSNDSPKQAQSLSYDEQNQRFVIVVGTQDFLSGDEISIVYNFAKYVSQGILESPKLIRDTIKHQQAGRYEVDGDITRYFYPISEIGEYTGISVQIMRPNTSPSNAIQANDVNFNLFSYGAGTEDNPYMIFTVEHLLNIRYFPSANYKMIGSIDMSEVDIEERLASNNGALIASEFSGVLDGDNYKIHKFEKDATGGVETIKLTDATTFALFGRLNGAKITNLNIGEENIQLILLNTIANSSINMLKLSLIATGATNSILDNVNVMNYHIQVNSGINGKINPSEINIAGLISEDTGSTISNSEINFSSAINISISESVMKSYFAGMLSKANKTNINSSTVKFSLESQDGNTLAYVGGIVAHYEGSKDLTKGLTNTKATFTMVDVPAMYAGGLIGFAKFVNINSCETNGLLENNSLYGWVYYGGLIGHAQGSIIKSSGSFIDFELILQDGTENKYIGYIVGLMNAQDGIGIVIEECYSNNYIAGKEQTTFDQGLIIGMCGSSTTGSNISVTGCYNKSKE